MCCPYTLDIARDAVCSVAQFLPEHPGGRVQRPLIATGRLALEPPPNESCRNWVFTHKAQSRAAFERVKTTSRKKTKKIKCVGVGGGGPELPMRRTAGVVRDHQGVEQANVAREILCMILHIRCSRCGGTSVKRQRKEPRLSAASCEGESSVHDSRDVFLAACSDDHEQIAEDLQPARD